MVNKNLLFCTFWILTLCSCEPDERQAEPVQDKLVVVEHYNIIVAIDLTNRIDRNKPINDSELVKRLLYLFKSEIIRSGGRDQNQLDRVFIQLINGPELLQSFNLKFEKSDIDLNKYTSQAERRDFLFGSAEEESAYQNKADSIVMQLQNCLNTLKGKSNRGADLWAYFENVLGSYQIKRDTVNGSYRNTRIANVFRNKLIVITDGYIETSNHQCQARERVCYDLKKYHIDAFRQNYNEVKATSKISINQFFTDKGYAIYPVTNPALTDLDILVLECDDRSVNTAGSASMQPSDFRIIELFWKDWLLKAGAKRVVVKEKVKNIEEFDHILKKFVGY